jgi:predicted nucleotidyltransferase
MPGVSGGEVMIDLVTSKQAEIEALCEEYGVRKLALFGSAAVGNWHEETSDLDFLVDIGNYDDRVGKRFMGLLAGLDRLFGDNIDVISEPAIKSDDFRSELQRTAVTLYERSNE